MWNLDLQNKIEKKNSKKNLKLFLIIFLSFFSCEILDHVAEICEADTRVLKTQLSDVRHIQTISNCWSLDRIASSIPGPYYNTGPFSIQT
jgi:hypothetical protein